MDSLIEKILSRGYWRVVIRPAIFHNSKIDDIHSLYPIIEKSRVSIGRWDFPHVEPLRSSQIGVDRIGQEFDWQHHLSVWHLFQSGQFFHLSNIRIDWRDKSELWPPDDKWKPGTLLGVGDTIATFTEIFEFAARFALTDAGDDHLQINITVGNLRNRYLYVDSSRKWGFLEPYKASIDNFPYNTSISRTELISETREIAIKGARELFYRFGWEVKSLDSLRDWQKEIFR